MSDVEVKTEVIPSVDILPGLPGAMWIVAFVALAVVLFSEPIGQALATTYESGSRSSWSPDVAKANANVLRVFAGLVFLGAMLEQSVQRIVGAIEGLKDGSSPR